MNISTVNELIQSLESASELSIKERKYLELAKAYLDVTAENVGLKNAFGPGDAVLNFLTIALRHTTYDQIDLDDVTLAFKMSLPETPVTDRIVAGIKADGANQICVAFVKHKEFAGLSDDDVVTVREATDAVLHCAEVISEGADK
ncbi:Uncharacterised protein [Klebsiella pneumoniae]|uniref:hypothetical protein n=1 Tax=Klebsiella pneumoniae TaxID=573 RepID=UPI000E2B7DCD|nr:hypothetical protein [Klebsiella pneumoniae]SYV38472.1 Uncharacterised protein [Klebsiella pneumoniae]